MPTATSAVRWGSEPSMPAGYQAGGLVDARLHLPEQQQEGGGNGSSVKAPNDGRNNAEGSMETRYEWLESHGRAGACSK